MEKEVSALQMLIIHYDGIVNPVRPVRNFERKSGGTGYINVYFSNHLNPTTNNPDYHYEFTSNQKKIIYKVMCQDINKDGKDEILFFHLNYIYQIFYNNNQFSIKGVNFLGNIAYNGIYTLPNSNGYSSLFADDNKDSYLDLVIMPQGNFDNYKKYSQIFYGSKDGYNETNSKKNEDYIQDCYYYGTGGWDSQIGNGDFNADGKSDIMVYGNINKPAYVHNYEGATVFFDPNWNNLIKDTRTSSNMMYDFNNDGITDIIIQGDENAGYKWKLIPGSPGYNHSDPIDLPFINCCDANWKGHERDFAQMIDYNGDGFMDVVIADETWKDHDSWTWLNGQHDFVQTDWYFYKNTGGTFVLDKQFTTTERLSQMRPTISDINGDGIDELIFPYKLTTDVDEFFYTALSLPNSNRRNLVKSITNGMSQTESFTYINFSGYESYDVSEATSKIRPLRAPLLVVDTYTQPDGSLTTYNYEKPKVHIDGKGFLGFSSVSATNSTKNIKAITNYEVSANDNLYRVYQTQQIVQTADGKGISATQLTNGKLYYDTSGNLLVDNDGSKEALTKRFIPLVSSQTATDELKGVVQTTTSDYGAYPSIVKQTVEIKTKDDNNVASKTITTTENQYKKDGDRTSSLIPYLPKTITTERNAENGTYTRVTGYTYTDKGSVATETKDPGNAGQVITEYSDFDPYGHPLTTTIKAAKDATGAQQSREAKVTYLNGRFISSKTNVLKETTNYSWDESLGTLTSETDAYKHTTSYRYNAWGQLTETTYPNGIHKISTLQWATNPVVTGAKYYLYTEVSAGAPVTEWYDALGHELQSDTYGLNNKKVSVSTEYYNTTDVKNGKVFRVSEPCFDGDSKIWAKTYDYDVYGRPNSVTTPMGTSLSTYVNLTTTVTSPTEGTHKVETDAEGKTIKSTTNDKTVSYEYYPSGQTKSSKPDNGIALTMSYDLQGHRLKLTDPDAGVIRNEYNGFGELLTERQKIHSDKDTLLTKHNYDEFGVLQSIDRGVVGQSAEHTAYTYDTHHRVQNVEIKNQHSQTFTYDDLDRVINVKEVIDGQVYNTAKKYEDPYGRLTQEIYPSGYYTVNSYDKYSNLIAVTDGQGRSIWKAGTENARGQTLTETKGNVTTTYSYYANGLPQRMSTPAGNNQIVDMGYTFYGKEKRFCLSNRTDYVKNQQEDFDYDGMNRLTSWKVNNSVTNTISYDDTYGNIKTKSDIGGSEMKYGENGKPHALTGITATPANFPTADLQVTYTDFKKIATLDEGTKHYELTYGVDDQRRKSVYYANSVNQGTPTMTRYYLGDYEEEVLANGTVRKIHYLSGAIYIETTPPSGGGGAGILYYTYSDYQGSLLALADANGNVVERYAYDPWGARRNPTDWTQKDSRTSWLINRGYTGHEHLDAFGIINMNGRVYDPLTAQFFSPDPYVQAPDNWLNYNRYTYCLGNPFKYTDPSGELFFYVIPSFSYSYYGGLQVNVSVGLGFSGTFSAGISAGYNFKYGNWSVTANASLGGLYGYAGYDSKAGFIAGVGFGFPSPISGISSNLLGASVNYSAQGGASLSMFGFNMGSNGVQFDPSVGVSLEFRWGSERYAEKLEDSQNNNSQKFQYDWDYQLNEFIAEYVNKDEYNIETITAYDDDFDMHGDKNTYRDKDGWIREYLGNGKENLLGGVTYLKYRGLNTYSDIYLSRDPNRVRFISTIDHELTHAYINSLGYSRKMDKETYKRFTESSAYFVGSGYIPNEYYQAIFPLLRPPHLIPIPNF